MKRVSGAFMFTVSAMFLLLAGNSLAQVRDYSPRSEMWRWGMSGFMGPFIMIMFWIVMIAVVILIIRWIKASGSPAPGESALDILKKRYARGEISKEEFEEMKKDID